MSSEIEEITIDLVVDNDTVKVLFAEVDADFLDVLLSFLTIRVGKLHTIHHRRSNIGCIDTLYQSVTDIKKYMKPELYDWLLISRRVGCIDTPLPECNKTRIAKYYCFCQEYAPSLKSLNYNGLTYCKCGILFSQPKENGDELLFLKKQSKFVITDGLIVKPITRNSSTISMLSSIGVHLGNSTHHKRVTITVKDDQVIDLFKRCLVSSTPLSDVFLPLVPAKNDKPKIRNLIKSRVAATSSSQQRTTETISSMNGKRITIKLLCDKMNNRVLLAEAHEDFVDLLISFCGCSLSELAYLLSLTSPFTSLYNLHRTARDLEVDIYKSENHKSNLYDIKRCTDYLEQKLTGGGASKLMEKGLFIVTDDLHVTPFSVIFSTSILQKFNISMKGIEERVVSVNKTKAMKLLMGLLTSKMALTNAFLK